MDNLGTLCRAAIDIIKETGSYIRTERTNFDQGAVQNKSARDLVSYVDQTAERMLVEKLSRLLPEAGFITEEKTTDKTGTVNWIVDPLDGTTNYITGFPLYSSTLALAEGNDILLGVTYEITSDKCFYAWKGNGAFCNNEKIKVKNNDKLDKGLVIIGTPYSMGEKTTGYFDMIRYIYENSLGIRLTGSAAIDMAYIAAGYADAFIEFNLHSWDIAAGYLLVKEAGGFASTFAGIEDVYCPEIIATGNLQKEFLELSKKYFQL
jgi:myo-inositol-1(or 4)-monophosphatase